VSDDEKRETRERVRRRVEWWLNDAAFKPPEQLTGHYYRCMAEDIADMAVDAMDFRWSSVRLDPPLAAVSPADTTEGTG